MDSRPSFNISNNVAHANSQQIITTYYDPNGHNASVQACLRTLDCPDVDAVRTEIHSHDGVISECIEWIFQDDRFRQWKEQEGNAILWIYGSPGKGKTRMAAGIVDNLRRETGSSSTDGLIGFFFCRSMDDRMNNAVDVLKGIIRTLWEQRQSLKEHVHHHWIEEEQKFDTNFNQVAPLWNLFGTMTKDVGHQATYIVIDAIDECSEQVEHLLRLIHTAGLVSPPNVKWLITSRPSNLDLQGSIWSYHRPMQIDLDSFTVQMDDAVQRYIKVKTAWMELSRFSVDDQARICKLILTKSESTFLWVAFVCQEVRNLPASEAIRVISAMPDGLHRLYEKNMQLLEEACHDSNEFAIHYRKLVWTLYNLSGSPHLLELAVLAGLPMEKASDESYLIRVIRECNTFMVLTNTDAVMLVHKSVKDYLDKLQSMRSQLVKSPTHGVLARRCIRILRRSLHRNLTELRELDFEAKEANLQLQRGFSSVAGYSCVHWIEHVVKDRISNPITINIFLRLHLMHWLEAISILGRYRTCLEYLIQLDTNLKAISIDQNATPSNLSPSTRNMRMAGLHEFVKNVRDFVAASRNVIERWPLQAYSSASMFFASEYDLNRVFEAETPDWILSCLLPRQHSWHPRPSMTIEHDHAGVTEIVLSGSGEHLVTSSSGTVRVWRLEEPIRFIELTCEMLKADPYPSYGLKIMIEGSEIKATWVDEREPMIRWATWDLDSEEPTSQGFYPVAAAAIDGELRLHIFSHLEKSEPQKYKTYAQGPGQCSCISSSGKLFANVHERAEKLRIFSTLSGEELPAISIRVPLSDAGFIAGFFNDWLTELRFCRDDKMIIYAARNKTKTFFVVCNLVTSEVVVRTIVVDNYRDFLDCLWATDKDCTYIACDTGCDIHILEIATSRIVQVVSAHGIQRLALSTSPLRMAAVTDDKTVRVWDFNSEIQDDLSSANDPSVEGNQDITAWLPTPDNKKVFYLYGSNELLGCDRSSAFMDPYRGTIIGKQCFLGSATLLANVFSTDSALLAFCYSFKIPFLYMCSGDIWLDVMRNIPGPPTGSAPHQANDRPFTRFIRQIPGINVAVQSVPDSDSEEPSLENLNQDPWTVNVHQAPLSWPSWVAVSFSDDSSRLLYSVANGPMLTVGIITIGDHQDTFFMLRLPDYHLATRISSAPQAICVSADHSLVALSCSVRTLGPNKFNIFVIKDRLHFRSGKGFAEGVRILRFSASAELLAALSEDGHIRIFRIPKDFPAPSGDPAAISENGHIRIFRIPEDLPASSGDMPESLQYFDIADKFVDQKRIIRVEFTEDGRKLKTNLGNIDISSGFEHGVATATSGLYLDDHWICMQGKRLVYLPPDYRPDVKMEMSSYSGHYGFVIQDSFVWIKTLNLGFVTIEFDLDLLRRLIRDHELV